MQKMEFLKQLIKIYPNHTPPFLNSIMSTMSIKQDEFYEMLANMSDILQFEIENQQLLIYNLEAIREGIIEEKQKADRNISSYDLSKITNPEDCVYYQGVPIYKTELDYLKQFNTIIGIPFVLGSGTNFIGGFVIEAGHIVKLGMDHRQLPSIPSFINKFPFLEELNFPYMGIREIPESILELTRLKNINLEHNQIRKFPDEIMRLKDLLGFNLSYNQLRRLPNTLNRCKKLQYLSIGHNQIDIKQAFPIIKRIHDRGCYVDRAEAFYWQEVSNKEVIANSGISQDEFFDNLLAIENMQSFEDGCSKMLTSLKKTDLLKKTREHEDEFESYYAKKEGNQENDSEVDDSVNDWALYYEGQPLLKDEHDYLVYLEKLLNSAIPSIRTIDMNFGFIAAGGYVTGISLSYLNLEELPEILVLFSNLEQLNIGNNHLSSLPEWIGELTHLKYLNVHKNHLFTLPASFCNLLNLEELDLSHNKLIRLSDGFTNLQKLTYLNLEGNHLDIQETSPILHHFMKGECELNVDHAYQIPKK